MKKFWKTLLSCLLMIISTLSICCCAPKPALDIDDAKDALEDADYDVEFITNPDTDEVEFAESIDKYLTAEGENDEYICMILFDSATMAKKYYNTLLYSVESEIKQMEANIKACEYYLKKYDEKIKSDERDEIEDWIKEDKKDIEKYEEEYCIGRSGKLVWYGSIDAIKDTK
ncbi:MAG: hypothetical protein E7349_02925 [Clostridiales bacterium]|nr:hypothetical protein [Clostridiales bacterium]